MAGVETACFVIADVSGYTQFLAGVELDHAQDILADLIGVVVSSLRPPFRLAKLEGDAAFVYSITDAVDGSLLQDSIEGTYFAFRRRLRDIRQATICQCAACRQMGSLDLKFVVHHGEMAIQEMAGQPELVGRDVILVHRLLKNAAAEKVGGHAYALFSDRCVKAMGIDPLAHDMRDHREAIDFIGETEVWIWDLELAWQASNDRNRVFVSRDEAALVLEAELDAPRQLAWEYFTLPERRVSWQGAVGITEKFAHGRRGVGTQNHCAHGEYAMVERILDWRPFDYITMAHGLDAEGHRPMTVTFDFSDNSRGGTHVEARWAMPAAGDAEYFETMRPELAEGIGAALAQLTAILAARHGSASAVDEPALPPARARFLREPVPSRP